MCATYHTLRAELQLSSFLFLLVIYENIDSHSKLLDDAMQPLICGYHMQLVTQFNNLILRLLFSSHIYMQIQIVYKN